MKFVVLISVLLTSTPSVWAAAQYAAGMVLKVDLQDKTILLSCDCNPDDVPAGMAKFSVKEVSSLARLVPGQLVDFSMELCATRKASPLANSAILSSNPWQ